MQFDYTQEDLQKQEKSRKAMAKQKMKTYRLSRLYALAGLEKKAQDVASCGNYMEMGKTAGGRIFLAHACFCHDRLCPLCSSRKAVNMARELSYILDDVEVDHPNVRYVFLTLTMRNCSGNELPERLKLLTKAWWKLYHHRDFERAVNGWFRSIEITRKMKNPPELKYHPHIHAVLAVLPEYFDKKSTLYLNQQWWIEHWQRALGADYAPTVDIRRAYMKPEKRAYYEAMGKSSEYGAAVEAAKYPVKDSDYINSRLPEAEAVQVVMEYAAATRGRRFTAFGGWLKESARKLKLERDSDSDEDLTDFGDREIRDDICTMIFRYSWNFGARDYILEEVKPSPEMMRIREADARREAQDLLGEQLPPEQMEIPDMGEKRKITHWDVEKAGWKK